MAARQAGEDAGTIEIEGRKAGDVACDVLKVRKGAVLRGDVTAREVVLYGTVLGIVKAKTVVILQGGGLHGEIEADSVKLAGDVSGVVVTRSFVAKKTSRIEGHVVADSYGIEPGARVSAIVVSEPGASRDPERLEEARALGEARTPAPSQPVIREAAAPQASVPQAPIQQAPVPQVAVRAAVVEQPAVPEPAVPVAAAAPVHVPEPTAPEDAFGAPEFDEAPPPRLPAQPARALVQASPLPILAETPAPRPFPPERGESRPSRPPQAPLLMAEPRARPPAHQLPAKAPAPAGMPFLIP